MKTIDEMLNAKSEGAVVSRMWNRGDGGFVAEVRWWSTKFPMFGLFKSTGEGNTRHEAIADACIRDGERMDQQMYDRMNPYTTAEGLPDDWILVIDDVDLRAINVMQGQHAELDVEVIRSHLERRSDNERKRNER